MKATVAKEIRWEMSHRLPFHDGPCKNIHGHSYMLRIAITGTTDAQGIVIDFYDVEKIMRTVVDKLDHSFVCDPKDEKMINFLKENNFKYLVMPDYTTAENIATYVLENVSVEFEKFANLEKISIRLHETKDAFAEIEKVL